jgi:NTE family protein
MANNIFEDKNINKTIEDELYCLCDKNKHGKTTLILGGGGVKGFVFVGIIKYLEELNILQNIHTYVGTSIGSLFVALLIMGYSADEMYKIIKAFDLTKITNIKISSFLHNYAIDDCENINNLYKKLLETKKFDPEITMIEFYKKTKKKFVSTSVCITTKQLEYMSYENFPDLPVYLAIRMSTCIPIVFSPVKFNNKMYIDGGLIENFPIHYISDDKLNEVIGINIFTDFADEIQIDNIITYITNIFDLIMMLMTKKFLEPKYKNIVYNIDVDKMNPVGFDLSIKFKKDLIKYGYDFMKKNFRLI